MCNENSNTHKKSTDNDYRFIDYRLDQLENKITKGLEKLEKEQDNNYKELIKMLQVMQENNNEQTKQIIELNQRLIAIEDKIQCVDKLKEVTTSHHQKIKNLERRIDIYKQVLFWIGTTAGGAALIAVFNLIFK